METPEGEWNILSHIRNAFGNGRIPPAIDCSEMKFRHKMKV